MGIIRHHESDAKAAVDIRDRRCGLFDGGPRDRFGVEREEGVKQDRQVVLAHGVHADQRQGQIARVAVHQGA
ncbi:MAG: hypothetical protein O3A25_09255 [Acidobacteria bacterium]|nr:hypothetical protein [Acidobacteriota bacterium]